MVRKSCSKSGTVLTDSYSEAKQQVELWQFGEIAKHAHVPLISDRSGDGVDGTDAIAGVVCQQLQELW